MKSSKAWVVVIALQLLLLMGQWVGGPCLPHAQAQIPDSGQQLNQVIDELKAVNTKLDHMTDLLDSGKLQVRTVPPDEK